MAYTHKDERTVQIETLPVDEIARQAGDLLDQGYH